MYNLRYHLATIVSIFLSLAIGLVLGAVIAGSEIVSDSSSDLVSSLREEFNDITQENKELESQKNLQSEFASTQFTYWAKDRLQGSTVAIFTVAGNDERTAEDAVEEAVTLAGGSTLVFSFLEYEEEDDGQDFAAAVSPHLGTYESGDADAFQDAYIKAFLEEWLETEDTYEEPVSRPVTQLMIEYKIISLPQGYEEVGLIAGIVNIAYENEQLDESQRASDVASAAQEFRCPVVATQTSTVLSSLGEGWSNGLPAQYGVENNYGKYGVIALLCGGETGIYGPQNEEGLWYPNIESVPETPVNTVPASSTVALNA